jgi:tungstate transport system permease protein
MVIAQTILVLPIVIALTRGTLEELWAEYREHLTSLGLTGWRAIPTLIWDGRFALATGLLAGFGRASAEVGAVLIVGGNIAGFTRTMTTSIALETSKGDLPLALGLGLVLIALTVGINALAYGASRIGSRFAG